MASRSDYVEREVKLEADIHFELPDLREIVGDTARLPEQILRTTYFDTSDLRLWQRGHILRYRRNVGAAGDGTWTLKLPEEGTAATLNRTELSWPGNLDHIPDAALNLLRGIVRRADLGQVLELESNRQRVVLRSTGESPLGEIDDDIVTVKTGTRKGYRFRQIEVELGTDQSTTKPELEVVDAVLRELRKAGARADAEQKFAKSLGLGAASPEKLGSPKRGRNASVREVVQLSIANGFEHLLDHDVRLRLEPADPSVRAVHQARVATRRLRSDLKTFGPLLDSVWLDHTTTELKWLGDILGRVRDADVLAHRLDTYRSEAPLEAAGYEELASRLAEQRRRFSFDLSEALDSERYVRLLERLHAGAHHPPFLAGQGSPPGKAGLTQVEGYARKELPSLVRNQWRVLRRRTRQAGRRPSDRQLHRIRISSKQLRYAAEAVAPVVGKRARRTARGAERLQNILGKHHDAVAAEDWLRREAQRGSAAASFAAGRMTAEERRNQKEYRRQWKSSRRQLAQRPKWLS